MPPAAHSEDGDYKFSCLICLDDGFVRMYESTGGIAAHFAACHKIPSIFTGSGGMYVQRPWKHQTAVYCTLCGDSDPSHPIYGCALEHLADW